MGVPKNEMKIVGFMDNYRENYWQNYRDKLAFIICIS